MIESLASPEAAHGSVVAVGGLVLLGSILPVVPTGPILTAGVAVAGSRNLALVPVVIAVAAAAALLGDVVTFALTRFGGPRLVAWVGRRVKTDALDRFTHTLNERGGRFLVVSRLVPAGRIPCLLAAGVADFPWRSFLPYQTLGAILWALAYGLLGLAGGGLFSNPYTATGIALGLVVLVQLAQYGWTRAHR